MLTDSATTVKVNTDTASLIRVTNDEVNLEIDLGTGEASVARGNTSHVKGFAVHSAGKVGNITLNIIRATH